MSALAQYIASQQTVACRLEDILEALEQLSAQDLAPDAQPILISVARGLAGDLNEALDSVNLPKEGQS